jgi:hypothetical protein
MLRDLIHEDIWPAGKHHFAGACYTAFSAPLCERIQGITCIKNSRGDVSSGGGIVLANMAGNAFEVFSGRGGPANKHSRPKDLLDAGPDFGLFDEITATRGLLAYFHSRDKVGLCCQTTTENLTGKLICALAFVGGNLGKLRFLLCGEVDLHALRVRIAGDCVNCNLHRYLSASIV